MLVTRPTKAKGPIKILSHKKRTLFKIEQLITYISVIICLLIQRVKQMPL